MTFQDALTGLISNTATKIDLTGQPLTKEQIVQLCSALASNLSLQSLHLEEVGLTAASADILVNVLAHHTTLEKLKLDENPLGEAGIEAIINLFKNHPTVSKVSASVGTGATKTQRETLKQLNKKYKKSPKLKPSIDPSDIGNVTPVTPVTPKEDRNVKSEKAEAEVPPTYYDYAWDGKQLEAKEPGHYRVLLRILQNKQRGQLQHLEEKVTTLEQALSEQQNNLEQALNEQQKQFQSQLTQLKDIFQAQLQNLLPSVESLSKEVNTLQVKNAQLESLSTQRTSQLKNVLADEKVQQKFYAPKKEYLRHLFLATTPEIEEVILDRQDKLVDACIKGDLPLVTQIHKEGGCLNQPNRAGEYPLVAAIQVMHLHVVDYIDIHCDEVDMPWYEVKERCGDILEKMEQLLNTNQCEPINEYTTYQELHDAIRVITEVKVGEYDDEIKRRREKQVEDIKEMIKRWDHVWTAHFTEGGRYMNMVTNNPKKPITIRCIFPQSRLYMRNARIDKWCEEVRDARADLTEYVNRVIDENNTRREMINTYLSRMAKCAERVAQRKNKPVFNA